MPGAETKAPKAGVVVDGHTRPDIERPQT
jgi:hypothetical protein